MNESEIVLLEAHMLAAADEYFFARSPLADTAFARRVFEAGFKAASRAGSELAVAVAQTLEFERVNALLSQPPEVSDE